MARLLLSTLAVVLLLSCSLTASSETAVGSRGNQRGDDSFLQSRQDPEGADTETPAEAKDPSLSTETTTQTDGADQQAQPTDAETEQPEAQTETADSAAASPATPTEGETEAPMAETLQAENPAAAQAESPSAESEGGVEQAENADAGSGQTEDTSSSDSDSAVPPTESEAEQEEDEEPVMDSQGNVEVDPSQVDPTMVTRKQALMKGKGGVLDDSRKVGGAASFLVTGQKDKDKVRTEAGEIVEQLSAARVQVHARGGAVVCSPPEDDQEGTRERARMEYLASRNLTKYAHVPYSQSFFIPNPKGESPIALVPETVGEIHVRAKKWDGPESPEVLLASVHKGYAFDENAAFSLSLRRAGCGSGSNDLFGVSVVKAGPPSVWKSGLDPHEMVVVDVLELPRGDPFVESGVALMTSTQSDFQTPTIPLKKHFSQPPFVFASTALPFLPPGSLTDPKQYPTREDTLAVTFQDFPPVELPEVKNEVFNEEVVRRDEEGIAVYVKAKAKVQRIDKEREEEGYSWVSRNFAKDESYRINWAAFVVPGVNRSPSGAGKTSQVQLPNGVTVGSLNVGSSKVRNEGADVFKVPFEWQFKCPPKIFLSVRSTDDFSVFAVSAQDVELGSTGKAAGDGMKVAVQRIDSGGHAELASSAWKAFVDFLAVPTICEEEEDEEEGKKKKKEGETEGKGTGTGGDEETEGTTEGEGEGETEGTEESHNPTSFSETASVSQTQDESSMPEVDHVDAEAAFLMK
uniref:Uncharacterized protein n=1 Tax=Chromera velia CCMP2878 TaxID=1169474 RepID=A0A0G4G2P4_9ALVE|eukprot:Cvel_19885.t1-p1 / transcript=Cvel_19885.t1 / gene=Cvel_19885 / organism=Chromera_velia_CCMP2878 / gene_product=hypothetical protein / transcript_product=hypothetical protein / location=Cvel_scaffold1745:8556-15116(-) / protein_length=746 / sequence_SO=supercontig / SO=protein_coding / is_pseudo=false